MKSLFIPLFAALLIPSVLPAEDAPSPPRSIVYVASTSQSWKFPQPWDKNQPSRKRGLGAVIEGGRILVTGELTANATYIQLERPGDGAKATARVVARDYECNLALLEPVTSEGDFLANTIPLKIDGPARAGDKIDVWQLEDDGGQVITSGVLTRVEMGTYWLPGRSLLRYQLKGSLQNKAGSFIIPAVRDGKLAGIVLGYNADDQVADILPAPIIARFLADQKDGDYKGLPTLGVSYSRTLDSQFREWLKLPGDVGGVYISSIVPGATADLAGVKEGDVILSLADFDIDRRGYYQDPDFGSLNFGHIIAGKNGVGDKVEALVWRDGAKKTLTLTLTRKDSEDYLVEPWIFDRGPRYVVNGGMMFTELSRPFIRAFRDWKKTAPVEFLYADAHQEEFSEGREKLVILAYIIPTPATVGYENIRYSIVEEVNGKAIGSIRDLHSAFLSPKDGRHVIKLKGNSPVIYLDAAMAAAVDQQLEANGISPLNRLQ